MRRTEKGSLILYEFDTFEEYLDRASNPVYKQKPALKVDPYTKKEPTINWASGFGTNEFQQSLHHARFGWSQANQDIADWANLMVQDISTQLPKPEETFEKTGSFWDLGRVIEQDPDCWIHEEPSMDVYREGKGNIVRMVINTAASYGVFENSHKNRCAAVVALTQLLEKVGFYVQFEITTAIEISHRKLEFRTVAKRPGEMLNVGAISFWSSRDMERRIDFAICETMPECKIGHSWDNYYSAHFINYGGPIFTHDPGDICFDRMHSMDCNWNDPKSVRAYVVRQLAEQGVILQGDNKAEKHTIF